VKKTSKSERFWNRAAIRYEDHVNEGDEAAIALIEHTRKYFQANDYSGFCLRYRKK